MRLLEATFSITDKAIFLRAPRIYRFLYSFYKRVAERNEREVIRSLVSPGMIVLDIGANIGIYTDFLARLVGDHGEVHAFEPDPTNFALLAETLSAKQNVFLNHAAAADRTGELTLYRSSSLNVDHRTYDCGGSRATMRVPCVALDDYFPAGKRVDFVKLDVQGFEQRVLCGMQRILRDNKGIRVLLEYFPSGLHAAGSSAAELTALLADHGFLLYPVRNAPRAIPIRHQELPLNTLGYTNLLARRT